MELTAFDTAEFLRDYWQRKPLLIRSLWAEWGAEWVNPLAPDDLAGLACERGIDARLVTSPAPGSWQLEQGPFKPKRFAKLGAAPWTLLVQAADHHIPAVADLLAPFAFIPNWRIDDVMVSYAADGGGVGPHFDQYDVFLIQGLGQRRWQIGGPCDAATALLPHVDLRLLAAFVPVAEWVLNPGDILYLPPGIAHNGTAVGDDCMTYSVGFRAPSRSELIGGWSDSVLVELTDDDRYGDAGLVREDNPGEIGEAALGRLHAMIAETLGDRAAFGRWFGEHSTAPKNAEIDWSPARQVTPDTVRRRLAKGGSLERNPASRFAFVRTGPETGANTGARALTLFVDGESYDCSGSDAAFAEVLCANRAIAASAAASAADLCTALINRGSLAFAA